MPRTLGQNAWFDFKGDLTNGGEVTTSGGHVVRIYSGHFPAAREAINAAGDAGIRMGALHGVDFIPGTLGEALHQAHHGADTTSYVAALLWWAGECDFNTDQGHVRLFHRP